MNLYNIPYRPAHRGKGRGSDYDGIIITSVNSRDAIYKTLLKRGVPASKILSFK